MENLLRILTASPRVHIGNVTKNCDEIKSIYKEYADKGVQVEYNRYVNNSDGNLQLETYLMAGEDGGVDVFIGYGSKNSMVACYMITVIIWIPSDLILVRS